jgi:hypothetical protein
MAEGPRAFGLASPVGEVTILAGEFIHLAKSASVVVQDRGTDPFVGAIDGAAPCIWPEKPIAVSPLSALRRIFDVGDGAGQRRGPVVGILFRPPGARTVGRKGPGLASRPVRRTRRLEALKSGGSAVKPKIHGLALCAARNPHKRGLQPAVEREPLGDAVRPSLRPSRPINAAWASFQNAINPGRSTTSAASRNAATGGCGRCCTRPPTSC